MLPDDTYDTARAPEEDHQYADLKVKARNKVKVTQRGEQTNEKQMQKKSKVLHAYLYNMFTNTKPKLRTPTQARKTYLLCKKKNSDFLQNFIWQSAYRSYN